MERNKNQANVKRRQRENSSETQMGIFIFNANFKAYEIVKKILNEKVQEKMSNMQVAVKTS